MKNVTPSPPLTPPRPPLAPPYSHLFVVSLWQNLDINLLPGGSKQLLEKYEDESAREEKLERLEKLRAAKRSSKKVGTYTELTKEMKEMEFAAGMEAIDKKYVRQRSEHISLQRISPGVCEPSL